MSTTAPQIFWTVMMSHYYPRISKSVKWYILLSNFFISTILNFEQKWLLSQLDSKLKSEAIESVKLLEKSDLSHVCRPLFDLGLILPNVTWICNYFYWFGLENFS